MERDHQEIQTLKLSDMNVKYIFKKLINMFKKINGKMENFIKELESMKKNHMKL